MTAAADITYCKRFTTSLAILCVLSISTPAQTVGTDQNPPAPLGKFQVLEIPPGSVFFQKDPSTRLSRGFNAMSTRVLNHVNPCPLNESNLNVTLRHES
jgi:hypothetical protein